ncbi:MAG TPA: ankyrin repeat domain-containing protein, partial [Gammaproteobacteria bacterium]|nr:ankyrin repeat domain-containing protein [Gammaproteobacteria bacterium]
TQALSDAVGLGYLDIVRVLVAANTDVALGREIGLSLFYSVIYNRKRLPVCKFLLETMVQRAKLPIQPPDETIYSFLINALNHEHLKSCCDRDGGLRAAIRASLAAALTEKKKVLIEENNLENLQAELAGVQAIQLQVRLLQGTGGSIKKTEKKQSMVKIEKCMVDLQEKINSAMPEMRLIEAAHLGNLDYVQSLVGKGVNINCQDELGRTALYRAARAGHQAVVAFLLEHDAVFDDLPEQRGGAPLYIAAQQGHAPIVDMLIAKKANIEQVCRGARALYIAAQQGHEPVVASLLSAGADVNAATQSDNAFVPLYVATFQNHVPVVQMLVDAGADVCVSVVVDPLVDTRITPFDKAKPEVARILNDALDKKIRSFIPGLSGREDLKTGDYSALIDYFNSKHTYFFQSAKLKDAMRSLLALALKERVEALIHAGDQEVLHLELEGLQTIASKMSLLQGKGGTLKLFDEKTAMKEIKGLIERLRDVLGLNVVPMVPVVPVVPPPRNITKIEQAAVSALQTVGLLAPPPAPPVVNVGAISVNNLKKSEPDAEMFTL